MRLIFAFVFAAVACAPQTQTSPRATPAAAPAVAANPDPTRAVIGRVDGEPIRVADFDDEIRADLMDLENELQQRRMHLTWVGFEQALKQRLLEMEAKERGQTVEELIDSIAGAVEVSDDEIRKLYDDNRDQIPVSFEEAEPTLRRQLNLGARERAVREFSESLRSDAKIDYAVTVPELPRYAVGADNQPAKGKPNAPVTIVEFSDFQCPYCKQAQETLAALSSSYGDKVRLVYRDFPLSQHREARPAAAAAHCAMEQGKFWDFHDVLFENTQSLDDDNFRGYAEELSLDLDAFDTCLDSDRPEAAIAADEADARRLGVRGTPAIFINGVKLIGVLPLPLMKTLIDHELNRS